MKLLRSLATSFLALLLSIAAFAQASPYQPGSPLLLWKVSSGKNIGYVVAAIHVGDKSLYPLPTVMENAFASSNVLLVEADVRKIDQQALARKMATLGQYPAGDSLYQHIPDATRQKLETYLANFGIAPQALANNRPWLAGLTVTMIPLIVHGLDPKSGVDMHFLDESDGKQVREIESADWQIDLLASMPEAVAQESLISSLDQASKSEEVWRHFDECWRSGQAEELDAYLNALEGTPSPAMKAFSHKIREERNPKMAASLESCISGGDRCFLVVGAMHIIGKEGVLELLKSKGLTVEQLKVSAAAAASPTH